MNSLINRIFKNFKGLFQEDNLEFVLHAKNYITAEFFLKGLTFLSIPIITRLLTTQEYGILNIYTSIISIVTILFSLNIQGAIGRYYHEKGKEYAEFLGSNLIFTFFYLIIMFLVSFFFKEKVSRFLNISDNLFILAIVVAVLNVPIRYYLSYLQTSQKSKAYSTLQVTQGILLLLTSITWIYLLSSSRYLGKVYAQIIIIFGAFVYVLINFAKISKITFKVKHIIYSLKYGIPLIPHALSGFILAYFDRIAINQLVGSSATGIYSFAYNVGMIMNVFIMATNKSWVPIFYKNLKLNQHGKINDLAYNYSKYVYFVAIGLILFSKEFVIIMSARSYHSALYLVPVIIVSYIFIFLYTLYANYSFYRKKTHLISGATFIAGILNILLNYYFIPKFGYIAAAYTTLFSYFILFVFHYINVKFVLKEEAIPLNRIGLNFLVVLFIYLIYSLMLKYVLNIYIAFAIKLIILLIISWVWFIKKRNREGKNA